MAETPPPAADEDEDDDERADARGPDGRKLAERVPKSERIMNLIAILLRADGPLPVTEILGKVTGYDDGASRESLMRRFERDKKVLRDMGIPVEHTGAGSFGIEGYRIPREAFFLDDLRLPPQAGKILRALFAWAHAGGGEISQDLRSALVKLGYFVPEGEEGSGPARATEALDGKALDPKLSTGAGVGKNLELLSLAVFRRRRVKFRYHTMSRDETKQREVDPYGLGFSGQAWNRGAWYLVGFCHVAQGLRVFKVQRIRGEAQFARGDGDGPDYEIPAGFRVREHLGKARWEYRELHAAFAGKSAGARPEGEGEAPFSARVRFPAAIAAEVRSLVPSARQVDASAGNVTLEFTVDQRRPFERFLLRYVPRLEVLAPADLPDSLRALAREVVATYEGGA